MNNRIDIAFAEFIEEATDAHVPICLRRIFLEKLRLADILPATLLFIDFLLSEYIPEQGKRANNIRLCMRFSPGLIVFRSSVTPIQQILWRVSGKLQNEPTEVDIYNSFHFMFASRLPADVIMEMIQGAMRTLRGYRAWYRAQLAHM